MIKVGVIGVPFGKGQKEVGDKEKGLECAPDALRSLVLPRLKLLGVDVRDYGNVSYTPLLDSPPEAATLINYNHIVPILHQVSDIVKRVVSDGRTCLTIGGDHSLAAATISGHAAIVGPENVAIIYIDAHADINLSDTSPSGNMHGMPLAIASQEFSSHWKQFPGLELLTTRVPLKNIGFIGLRSVDPGELEIIHQHSMAAVFMADIVRVGIAEALRQLLATIDPANDKCLHVSIDIDSLDPLEAPCTTCPVRGGLLLRELLFVAEELHNTKRISAVDLVEVNTVIGSEEDQIKTLNAATDILLACFGQSARGLPA